MRPRLALFSFPHRRLAAPPGIARLEAKYAAQISMIMRLYMVSLNLPIVGVLNLSFKLKIH